MPETAAPLNLDALPGLTFCETHGSRVYLSGDRAYKVRKAVRFPFLDQTAVETRERLARTELEINQELAPSTYLAVRTAVVDGRSEPVVEMKRFAEADTLASRLADGRIDGEMLEQLGVRLATFHAGAPIAGGGGAAATLARLDRNAEELAGSLRAAVSEGELWRVVRPLEASILRHAGLLDERAAAGSWREGHGDLRADHVVFGDDGLQIVDRLEFDVSLRTTDVGDDLAFLLMDLESRGARWAAEVVLASYRDAGGDPGTSELLATWSAYRAMVSLKVALLRHAQAPTARGADRARALLALAERLAWRSRAARVYVACGPPASGKSTLAHAIAERTGFPVVSSDAVRKQALGIDEGQRAPAAAYTDAAKLGIYRELGERASDAVVTSDAVIVDATMGNAAMRHAFLSSLRGDDATVFIECRVPAAEADRRAQARLHGAVHGSDATPQVAARLAAAWEPLDEVPAGRHVIVRADRPISEIVDEVELSLDAVAVQPDRLHRDLALLRAAGAGSAPAPQAA